MDSALLLRDVTVRYGDTSRAVLDGASMQVAPGACVGLVAPPGAGTTTLLLCAAGLLGPASGAVRWFGSHRWHAARAAYAAARPEAHPYLSVRAWLEFVAAQVDDIVGPEPDVTLTLARAGLGEFARIRVGHLTPGVAARVALAGALLRDPRVVLLDRPLDGLSGPERVRFAWALATLRADGVSLVVASHDAAVLAPLTVDALYGLAAGCLAPLTASDAMLEIDVPLPVEARSRLSLRVPSVYRRGRALRVPLARVSPEQVLSECRALGIEVRASRLLPGTVASRRRVAEPDRGATPPGGLRDGASVANFPSCPSSASTTR
jgi:ABC-2 type transport system ATP-binding protein